MAPALVSVNEWQSHTLYSVGNRVRFQGNTYECIQAHTSQDDWTPLATPALWKNIDGDTTEPPDGPPIKTPGILPYAAEPFGVYQTLIGWRSKLQHERVSEAVTNRVVLASRAILRDQPQEQQNPPKFTDRTGTMVGRALAQYFTAQSSTNIAALLGSSTSQTKSFLDTHAAAVAAADGADDDSDAELGMAAVIKYLDRKAPTAVKAMFSPKVLTLDRIVQATALFTDPHPARSHFLSPIGILHMFRQYFFELGTFLGPPVGHVWISPGGSVELVEVNTRKTITELVTESSVETTNKTELDRTDKDELSDAIKDENSNNTSFGASATASGGFGSILQASGSASFNLQESRKRAQEQTHTQMREQTAKLSSEIKQNFKTTFRTVTETTDTSSRRYVLKNDTGKLASYELARKMRKVAVQVQDLGQRLCWQLYVDNPGDPLGTGEFVHASAAAVDANLKPPDTKPYPPNQQISFSSSIPFILYQGADHDAEDTYKPQKGNPDRGIFSPDIGKDDIIQFKHDIKCPPTPAGFVLSQVTALDFHGAQVKWDTNLAVDAPGEKFSIRLTYANFNGRKQLPFDVALVYEPTQATKDVIDKENQTATTEYNDKLAVEKEKIFYDTLRTRLKLIGNVQPRPSGDLRAEEQNVIYRNIVSRLYGNISGWLDSDYHVASEMIRYFFDVDAMLYFVAPDWWRPRTQQLVNMNDQGHLQPTVIAEPAVGPRIERYGKYSQLIPGHRPYYMITDETAPAPLGSSLGWLIQLDGDRHRNAFLNSPWVKAVLPIRPGREKEAITFLQRPEAADVDGLDEPYPFDAATDPPEYEGLKVKDVLLIVAEKIAKEYQDSLKPVPLDPGISNSKMALPTETVFATGFNPLEGGIDFGNGAFKVFSEWLEILPTDQVVAREYPTT